VRSSRKTTTATPVDFRVSHDRLRKMLRDAMRASGPAGGLRSVEYRVSAALEVLLAAHPVDQRGRCTLCQNPGTGFGFRRPPCLIYLTARYWLRQA